MMSITQRIGVWRRAGLMAAGFLITLTSALAGPIVEVILEEGDVEKSFQIEVNLERAPVTAGNFLELARKNFYKGMKIHRAIPGVLVQMGDPSTKKKDRADWGTGGPGYTLPAEIGLRHTKGAVAMARLPDNLNPSKASNGSQFFVVLRNLSSFNGDYTVFGRVVQGLDVLEEISQRRADANDVPYQPVVIRKTTVLE